MTESAVTGVDRSISRRSSPSEAAICAHSICGAGLTPRASIRSASEPIRCSNCSRGRLRVAAAASRFAHLLSLAEYALERLGIDRGLRKAIDFPADGADFAFEFGGRRLRIVRADRRSQLRGHRFERSQKLIGMATLPQKSRRAQIDRARRPSRATTAFLGARSARLFVMPAISARMAAISAGAMRPSPSTRPSSSMREISA